MNEQTDTQAKKLNGSMTAISVCVGISVLNFTILGALIKNTADMAADASMTVKQIGQDLVTQRLEFTTLTERVKAHTDQYGRDQAAFTAWQTETRGISKTNASNIALVAAGWNNTEDQLSTVNSAGRLTDAYQQRLNRMLWAAVMKDSIMPELPPVDGSLQVPIRSAIKLEE